MDRDEIIRLLAIHAAIISPIKYDIGLDAKGYEAIFSNYLENGVVPDSSVESLQKACDVLE